MASVKVYTTYLQQYVCTSVSRKNQTKCKNRVYANYFVLQHHHTIQGHGVHHVNDYWRFNHN